MLVYYEVHATYVEAARREKRLKNWLRQWNLRVQSSQYSQDQQSWAQSHINAFQFFGGVPRCIVLDNLKSGIIKAYIYDPTINETYAELSRFWGSLQEGTEFPSTSL